MEKIVNTRTTENHRRTITNTMNRPKRRLALSEDDRRKMIAETAYYMAEKRGFTGGDPMQDWLEAERKVDRFLGLP